MLICILFYVCMCASSCGCTYECPRVVEARGQSSVLFLRILSSVFLWVWSSYFYLPLAYLGRIVSKLRESACLCLFSGRIMGVQHRVRLFLNVVYGDWILTDWVSARVTDLLWTVLWQGVYKNNLLDTVCVRVCFFFSPVNSTEWL